MLQPPFFSVTSFSRVFGGFTLFTSQEQLLFHHLKKVSYHIIQNHKYFFTRGGLS